MKIFLIPGLGYDNRIFQNLNFGEFKVEFLNWIEPIKNEHISDYSKRLFRNKNKKNEQTILIGHSLGGIVAQEIANIYRIEKVILISSIRTEKENPLHFRILKPLGIYKIFTKGICMKTIKYWGKYHGFETKEDQDLFKSMIDRQSNTYLRWALKSLAIWKSPTLASTTKTIQLSGENDKNFPIKLIKNPDYKIKNGNHIMVFKQTEKINKIILEELHNSI